MFFISSSNIQQILKVETIANENEEIIGKDNVSLLLADDHSMIRRGLKFFLQVSLGCRNITEVASCSDLLREVSKNQYTHLILDIILKDGNSLEIIPSLQKLAPDLKIMIFSMQPAEIYGPAVQQYRIFHYIHKSEGEESILKKLNAFLKNESSTTEKGTRSYSTNPFSTLAPRELEILHYILRGYGTKQIGETLNLQMSTISTVKNRIFEKTKASNLKELLDLAVLYNINY
jgi:two-component system invasion response regulator UvrY